MTLRFIRLFVSCGVLAFPILATVGVLIGLNFHSESAYGHPLFTSAPGTGPGGTNGGGGSGGGGGGDTGGVPTPPINNGITHLQFCNKTIGVTPASKGQLYTLNPNQWGWTEGTPGKLCLNITTFNNQSYATDTTAPAFSVTWQFPQGPESEPVHAFSNIEMRNTKTLPVTISGLAALAVDVRWTYGLGNATADTTASDTTLTAQSLNANVAFDLFLDSDKKAAANTSAAAFEVMVWLADFGPATQPIGNADGIVATETVNGTTFNLYYGQNDNDQTVLTWIAADTTSRFVGDLSPLVTKLTSLDKTTVPAVGDYIGYVSFGTEALYADEFVTFSVPELSMEVEKS